MSNIKLLKFVSGEEVIAQVEDNGSVYTLKDPVRIALTERGAAIIPFSPFAKADVFQINREHFLFIADVDDDIKNEYNMKFGSGIVTTNSSIVLG